jgi:hypothetical protein
MIAVSMRWPLPVLLCAAAFSAAAQTVSSAGRKPDPLDAGVSVPAVAYESSFSRYRRTVELESTPWRESNDTAARIGGWRAYAREAQQPGPAPAAPPARPVTPDARAMPMPQGHGGHKTP